MQNEKFLQIKQNDKFFSKLLSKEVSLNKAESSSFRVLYYGEAPRAVPFMWESMPGTPKHTFSKTSLNHPPLTPPPSYQATPNEKSKRNPSKSGFCHYILPRFSQGKRNFSPSISSSSVSSSSSSSSCSLPPGPMNSPYRRRRGKASSGSDVQLWVDQEEKEEERGGGSPTSILCFGGRNGRFGGQFRKKNVKKNCFLSLMSNGMA